MHLHSFKANTPAAAVEQIRRELGSKAIVAHVHRVPASGFSRILGQSQIEVLAYVPEEAMTPTETLVDSGRNHQLGAHEQSPAGDPFFGLEAAELNTPAAAPSALRQLLLNFGLVPALAEKVIEEIKKRRTFDAAFSKEHDELHHLRKWLCDNWRVKRPTENARAHLFVGASGVGKTTILCKWLARTVLTEGKPARVCRASTDLANTAEHLEVYCNILGVPITRDIAIPEESGDETLFFDLPGGDVNDPRYFRSFEEISHRCSEVEIHLVLNAAYDVLHLVRQCRALSRLANADFILTRLDEEHRWGKIWNLFLGSSLKLRYANSGQNVPGDFFLPGVEQVLAREFPNKSAYLARL